MLNKIIRKRRRILIDKKDMVTVLEILCKYDSCWQDMANMKVGRCGWAKAPDCWFVHVNVTDKKWASILREFNNKKVTLLPETVGY